MIRNQINEYRPTSDWVTTNVGVPQASVIPPIVFIFYIRDLSEIIGYHIFFADDVPFWVSRNNLMEVCKVAQSNIKGMLEWCNMWRIISSFVKTELMCHSGSDSTGTALTLTGNKLKQVEHKKDLAVILDNKLSFNRHLHYYCNIALCYLSKISRPLERFHNRDGATALSHTG